VVEVRGSVGQVVLVEVIVGCLSQGREAEPGDEERQGHLARTFPLNPIGPTQDVKEPLSGSLL
jgi:hypothetical protein